MAKVLKTAHEFDKKWRSKDVQLKEKADFSTFLLNERVLVGLKNAGYKTPSPIQVLAIPPGLFGNDLLVQAKSGTGKTLVFTVIALQSLLDIKYPQVLIMAPTREIAVQVRDCIRAVGSGIKGLKCCSFIGGLPISDDEENIVDCQIVVGTPGRLKQLISIGFLKTNSIRILVLDEADTLLENVFINDLNYIFQSLPKAKQVIATSATYPKELKTFIRHYFRIGVVKARLNKKDLSLLGMIHYIKVVQRSKLPLLAYKVKLSALEKVLSSVHFTQCLVFCNLKSIVESLCCDIRSWGFTTTYISADKEQQARLKAIDNLKRFRCKVLVSSDVTARGIDAENVDLVVNFDKPFKEETYFHRCGRAGRYGSKGVAITFLIDDEVNIFRTNIENNKFQLYVLPEPIPKNLINIRPLKEKPIQKKDALDVEEQENSVDDNSDSSTENDFEITSEKENSLHISKIKKTKGDDKILLSDNIKIGGHTENSEGDKLPKLEEADNCASLISNGVSSNSEQRCININEKFSFESDCKNEDNEVHLKSTSKESVEKNVGERDIIEIMAEDKNSDYNSKEDIARDLEHQKENEFKVDSCLSVLPTNTSCESETLNIIQGQVEENFKNDTEIKSGQINDKLKGVEFEKDPESSQAIETNNSCQVIASDTAEVEPVKIAHFSEMQKSLAKFLVNYEANRDIESFLSSNQHDSFSPSAVEKITFPFDCDNAIAEKCKNIRKDLAGFYHKIYKAYQVQTIDETSFKDLKAVVMAEDKENNTSEKDENDTTVQKHTEVKTDLEISCAKLVTEKLSNKKNDIDSESSDSSDSTSIENNLQSSLNEGDQSFETYIFKGQLPSKSIPEESSDSDSESQSCNTSNRLSDVSDHTNSSSDSEKSFCLSSRKLPSKVCKVLKKPSCENNIESQATKNYGVKKKLFQPKMHNLEEKSSSKNENGLYRLQDKSSSFSQRHNGARAKNMKIFQRNASSRTPNVSSHQDHNKNSYVSKQQKKAFRNEVYENSRTCNYNGEDNSSSYPYNYQYHNYFPTSVTTNQPVFTNYQCPCFNSSISCQGSNNMYNIFLKQWEFIQNFSYP